MYSWFFATAWVLLLDSISEVFYLQCHKFGDIFVRILLFVVEFIVYKLEEWCSIDRTILLTNLFKQLHVSERAGF